MLLTHRSTQWQPIWVAGMLCHLEVVLGGEVSRLGRGLSSRGSVTGALTLPMSMPWYGALKTNTRSLCLATGLG